MSMTQQELYAILTKTGYKCYLGHLTGSHPMPYLTYQPSYSRDVHADDRVTVKRRYWQVDLYTSYQSQADEDTVEKVLADAGIPYSSSSAEDVENKFFQTVYMLDVMV